jgi:hypothetical protein
VIAPLVIAACVLLVHHTALRMFFAQDDVTFLSRAKGLESTPWSLARPLSEGWTWRALVTVFGLRPLPYHLLTMALHLANALLVYVIGLRILRSPWPALFAGVLFGASSIAFTPLHWTSCIVELLVTTFSLSAFALYLSGRDRGSNGRLALGALLGLMALLSKESAILFPLVLLVAHLRLEPTRAPLRQLVPQAAATALYAIGFVATLRFVHYIASEAYARSFAPVFLAANFTTYLDWIVALNDPIRDAFATAEPSAWVVGIPVALALAAVLWTQRREPRHPEEVGAAWFLAFLAPVVPLEHHTYLYYLYLPWAGLCWTLAGAAARAARGRAWVAWAIAALLAGFVAIETGNVRARETAKLGTFARDKAVREGFILKNAVTDLKSAELKPGDRIAFVNPAPIRHYAMADTTDATRASYVPLEGALRNGETIRLFFPGVGYAGLGKTIPTEWEDAEVFLYQDEGTLRHLGRGSKALAELGYFTLRLRDWDHAERLFLRSRALGDTLADATFGLIITSDYQGRHADSERYAAEFLSRWPDDPRARVVAGGAPVEAGP